MDILAYIWVLLNHINKLCGEVLWMRRGESESHLGKSLCQNSKQSSESESRSSSQFVVLFEARSVLVIFLTFLGAVQIAIDILSQ